jgi:hypothetical protein
VKTSERILARLTASGDDLAGLDAEIGEARQHLLRLETLRQLLAAVPAKSGASEEAPFVPPPRVRPRLEAPPPRPPADPEQAARLCQVLAGGPLELVDLKRLTGVADGRSLNGTLSNQPNLFRRDADTGRWHLTDEGRALAASTASAPPAPPGGTTTPPTT